MKRVVIFVLVLALAAGSLLFAHGAVSGQQENILLYPVLEWGDRTVLEGQRLQIVFDYNRHLQWDCTYDFSTNTTDTEFAYSWEQFPRAYDSTSGTEFSIGSRLNFGGTFENGSTLSWSPYGDMVRAVAQDIPDNESRSETLNMADFADYYLPIVSLYYKNSEMYCNITESESVLVDQWAWTSRSEFARRFSELFRFPVQPGEQVTVTAARDSVGILSEYGFSAQGDTTLYLEGEVSDEGVYFLPVFQDDQGQPLDYESPQGHGLYFAPWKLTEESVEYDDGSIVPRAEPDLDRLELVTPFDPTGSVVQLELDVEADRGWLLTKDADNYVLSVVELSTGKILSKTTAIPRPKEAKYNYGRFVLDDGYVLVSSPEHLALLEPTGGALLLTASTEHPGEFYHKPWSFEGNYGSLRYDGEYLTIAARSETQEGAFWVQVYRQGELLYHGEYDASLTRSGIYVTNWSDIAVD